MYGGEGLGILKSGMNIPRAVSNPMVVKSSCMEIVEMSPVGSHASKSYLRWYISILRTVYGVY